MKKLILSRGPQVDIQRCTKLADHNKFSLVLIAAQRARDLRRQNPNSRTNFTVDALLDLQAETINPSELLEKRVSYKSKTSKKVDTDTKKKVK